MNTKPRVWWMPCFEIWCYRVHDRTQAYAPTLWQLEKIVRYGCMSWGSYLSICECLKVEP